MQRVFRGPDADEQYRRAGMWLLATVFENRRARSWCDTKGVIIKAQTETVDSAGGFLVPEEVAREIADTRDQYGVCRRRIRIVPMGSSSVTFPKYTGAVTAYFTGENLSATETAASVDASTLTAQKLLAYVKMSSELDEDSLPDAVDLIVNELAWAFAKAEDNCAFIGDGTSTYGKMTGIANLALDANHTKSKVTAAAGHNTYATLTNVDVASLMGAVRASAMARAAWFVSEIGFAHALCRLAANGTGFIDSRIVDGVPTPCYLGFPVIATQALPQVTTTLAGKVMMAFGDLYAGGMLGQRRGFTVARAGEHLLEYDQIAIRASERVHIVINDMGDNSNFGSIAALVGGA